MKQLIGLQRSHTLTFQACDKGGGIIVLDTPEYIRSCYAHLSSTTTNSDGTTSHYYEEVEAGALDEAKKEILEVLKVAKDEGIISEIEFKHMDPSDKSAARYYQLFKVHKQHTPGSAPPERPIVSGSGSITENISKFVQHHIRDLSTDHPSYIQDTPDMLRCLEDVGELPDNAVLVTIDVVGLYTNIPRDLGIEIVKQKLETRKNKEVPTDFLIKLLELLLKFNIFEFDEKFFNQLLGTSMGTKAAPNYADIVMAYMDKKILEAAAKFGDGVFPVMFFKRFLDDLKFIFLNNHKRLHEFLAEINKIHPSFRFTMTHTKSPGAEDTCDCPDAASIPFLDLSISIKNKKISTDLYRKPSDKVQYLLPSSCHPNHCTIGEIGFLNVTQKYLIPKIISFGNTMNKFNYLLCSTEE